jgi:hypothetical protein
MSDDKKVQPPKEIVDELPASVVPKVFAPQPKPIAIFKAADQVFMRGDEERVAHGLGLKWEDCAFTYAKETRPGVDGADPIKGVKLTGARK